MKHKGVSHDDLHRPQQQRGERVPENRGCALGEGEGRDSFRISKCLLGSACAALREGRETEAGGGQITLGWELE